MLFLVTSLIFAPLLENLALVGVIEFVRKFFSNRLICASVATVILVSLHALVSPLWALTVAIHFFVLSTSYLGNREIGKLHSYGITVAIHAVHNAPACLALLLGWHI